MFPVWLQIPTLLFPDPFATLLIFFWPRPQPYVNFPVCFSCVVRSFNFFGDTIFKRRVFTVLCVLQAVQSLEISEGCYAPHGSEKVTAVISFSGREQHIGFLDSKKWSFPVQHVAVCVIPAFCIFMVSGELLKQLGAFRVVATPNLARPFLVSPPIKIEIENSLKMALSKAKSGGGAWQSHFWQCGTLRPARNTKLFTLRK